MVQLPLTVTKNADLLSLGIDANCLSFYDLSIDSDKFITICEKNKSVPQVAIIDSSNPTAIKRFSLKGQSARLNPVKYIIALKSGNTLQVSDLTNKENLHTYVLPEEIDFMKWTTPSDIFLVSKSSVYRLNIESPSPEPLKVFNRSADLVGAMVINFQVDINFSWMALVALTSKDNIVCGSIQLYSREKDASQNLQGHACTFTQVLLDKNSIPSNVFVFANRDKAGFKLCIYEVGFKPGESNHQFPKSCTEMRIMQGGNQPDFPLSIHPVNKSGLVFIITKCGVVYLYELETASCLFSNILSQETLFASANLLSGKGFICVNRIGYVLNVAVNEEEIVPYLISINQQKVAFTLATRAGYPGAESAFTSEFNRLFNAQLYKEAAHIAAVSTGNSLRNSQTIARFKALPSIQGFSSPPIIFYFNTLLETGPLNALESFELCQIALSQGGKSIVEKLLQDRKLECSEELGDLAKSVDPNLGLSIYLRASCHQKVIQCFAENNQFDKITEYASKVNYQLDYLRILRKILYSNPDSGLQFAINLVKKETPGLDIGALADCFEELNLKSFCCSFLVDALRANRPEHADLQTRLLELSLRTSPQVAEAIFSNNVLTYFDRNKIAHICEEVGMVQRAIQFYTDVYDIKRAIVNTRLLNHEWLVHFFGTLSVEDTLSCLRILIENDKRANIDIVCNVAKMYAEQLGIQALISIFEDYKSMEGLFEFLNHVVWTSTDPEVHFKFLQAACKTNHRKELERICKESTSIDPERAKNFLKEARLSDQIPLIIICDRFNMVSDLVLFLHKNNYLKHIETYVHKANPARLPEIVGSLLDVDCSEQTLISLIVGCPPRFSIDELISLLSERNRISLLKPLVEARISSGSNDANIHTALAIVRIDSNQHPESVLKENSLYDTLVVGRYCENRDPSLALIAYAKGNHDQEYIRVCVNNSRFKDLARYIISRESLDLWANVLDPGNDWRRTLMDQASQVVLNEEFDPKCISVMVKALMAADLPTELIALLEKLVLADSPYSTMGNIQNLLLLTAIKNHPSRLLDYVNRLDSFNAKEIASLSLQNNLFEEAFAVYKKFELHSDAVRVLADYLKNFERAQQYAERVNIPEAWSVLGCAQLKEDRPKEALVSLMKAEDYSHYTQIIAALARHPIHEQVLMYLSKVQLTVRDSIVDSEYAYCLAYTNSIPQLKEYLDQTNAVNFTSVGDRLYEDNLFEAALILYTHAKNFPKLVCTYVRLGEYQKAIEMARKANNSRLWKDVLLACLDAKEPKSAQICALALVIHPHELESLVSCYEQRGLFDELVSLFETAINTLQRAPVGVFTEMAVLFAKYRPERLKDYLDIHWTKVNIPKALNAAETYRLWTEVVFLHDKYEEFDQAVLTMIRHPASAFSESHFKELILKVSSQEVHHKAIQFYYEYRPLQINEILIALSQRLDHHRTISQLKNLDILPLCKPYLIHVQSQNLSIINDALNDILIQEVAHEELRTSIETYSNFDVIHLAERLESHPSVEIRRVACLIRKISNRWSQAIEMAKQDGLHGDALLFAAESKDPKLALSLLDHLISIGKKDHVLSLLYICYDLLDPDVVLEACWIGGLTELCMPYFIQQLKDMTLKISSLESHAKLVENEINNQTNSTLPITPSASSFLSLPPPSSYGGISSSAHNVPRQNPFI